MRICDENSTIINASLRQTVRSTNERMIENLCFGFVANESKWNPRLGGATTTPCHVALSVSSGNSWRVLEVAPLKRI